MEGPGVVGSGPIETVPGEWHIRYQYTAGPVIGRFLQALRDEERILGRRCPRCHRVYLPPRAFCEACFVDTAEWVEVGPEGRIETFTVCFARFEGLPDPPYAIAFVRLNGADTCLVNFLRGVDVSDPARVAERIRIGDRVRAVFKKEREGRITDFYFEPVR